MGLFHKLFGRRGEASDREILLHILRETNKLVKGQHAMALDLTKLNAATDRLIKADDAVLAAHSDPAAQAAVDAVADKLDVQSVKSEAAVAPAPAPAA